MSPFTNGMVIGLVVVFCSIGLWFFVSAIEDLRQIRRLLKSIDDRLLSIDARIKFNQLEGK